VATMRLPAPVWESYQFFPKAWQSLVPEGPLGFLTRRLEVSDQPLASGEKPRLEITKAAGQHRDAVTVQQLGEKKAFIADSLGASVFAGFLGGKSLSAQQAQVTVGDFANNFAAITLVATDRQYLPNSARILVTVCGQVQNQGITWNEKHNSIGANWGHGPTIAQFVPATISLETDGPRKVYTLDSAGKRQDEVPSARDGHGRLSFRTSPEHATLLYEIAK
jgi:hypothetical protein